MNRLQNLRRDFSKSTEDNSPSGTSKPAEKKKKKGLLSLFHRKKSSKRHTVQFGNAETQTIVSAVPELSDHPSVSQSRSSSISPERYLLDHRRLSERGLETSPRNRGQIYSSSCDELATQPSIPETEEVDYSRDPRYSSMMEIPESDEFDRYKSTPANIGYGGKMSQSSIDVSNIGNKSNYSYRNIPMRDENLSNSTTSEISRAASSMEIDGRPVAPVRRKKSLRGLSTQHAPNFNIRAESYAAGPTSGTGGFASCSVPDVRGAGNLERRNSHTSSHSSGFDEAYSSQSNYDVTNGEQAGVANGSGVASNTTSHNSGLTTATTIADSVPTTSTDTLVGIPNSDILSATSAENIMKAGNDTTDNDAVLNGVTLSRRKADDSELNANVGNSLRSSDKVLQENSISGKTDDSHGIHLTTATTSYDTLAENVSSSSTVMNHVESDEIDKTDAEKAVRQIDLEAQDKVHEDLMRTLATSFDDLSTSKFFDIDPIRECDSNKNKLKSHKSPHVSFIDISDSADQRFDRFVKDKNLDEDRSEDTTSYKVFLEKAVSPTRLNRVDVGVQRRDSSLTRRNESPYIKNHRKSAEAKRSRSGGRYLSDVSKMFERRESSAREISPARSESHLFVKTDDLADYALEFNNGYKQEIQPNSNEHRLNGLLKSSNQRINEKEPMTQSESLSSLMTRCPLNNRNRQTEILSPSRSRQTEILSPSSDRSSGSENFGVSSGRVISSPGSSNAGPLGSPLSSSSYQNLGGDQNRRVEHSGRSRQRNYDRYKSNISMQDVQAAIRGPNSDASSPKGPVLHETNELMKSPYSATNRQLGRSDFNKVDSKVYSKNIDTNAMDRIFGKQENIEKVPGYISPHEKCIYVDFDKDSAQNLSEATKLEEQNSKSKQPMAQTRDKQINKENISDNNKLQNGHVKYSSAMELRGIKTASSDVYNSTDEISSRYGVTSLNDVTPGMKQRQRLMERMRKKSEASGLQGTNAGSALRTRRTFEEQSADLKNQYSRIYQRLMETPESGSNLRKSESWNTGIKCSSNDRLFSGAGRKSYDHLDSIDELSHSQSESIPKYNRNNSYARQSSETVASGPQPALASSSVFHSRQRLIDRRITDPNIRPDLSFGKTISDATTSHAKLFRTSTYDVAPTPDHEANSRYAIKSQTGPPSSNSDGLIGLLALKSSSTASMDNINSNNAQNYYRPRELSSSAIFRSNSSHSTMSPQHDYIAAKRERNPVLKSILKKAFDRSISSDDSVFASSPIVKSSGSYQLPVVREVNTNLTRLEKDKDKSEVKQGGTYSGRYYQMTMSPDDQRNNLPSSSRPESSSKYSSLPNYQRPR